MKTGICSLDHPILFVGDNRSPNWVIPEYSPGSLTAATSTCVSVQSIIYLDGEVTVHVATATEPPPLDGLQLVFDGEISTPSRNVAVVTAENNVVVEVEVTGERTRVKISVNRLDSPDEVLVVVS